MPAHCFISLEWFRNRTKLPIGIFTGRVGAEAFTVYIYIVYMISFIRMGIQHCVRVVDGRIVIDVFQDSHGQSNIYIYINTYKDNVNQETDYIYIYKSNVFKFKYTKSFK